MMRVRFGQLSAEEEALRERACACAREAWACVVARDDARAAALLQLIDENVSLQVERDSADARPHLELSALEPASWPLARLLLEQVPADLDVTLSLGRAAVSLEQAVAEVEAQHGVALGRATLRAGFTRGHLLEITIGVPGGSGGEIEQISAENLVRAVLGDRLFETWVGSVHSSVEPRLGSLRVLDVRAPRTKLQVQELFDTVAAAVRGVLAGLPDRSRAERGGASSNSEWTMLEVEPLAETATGRKEDLLLASTCMPELLRCYLDGAPCSSSRFSRSGEVFVFVSYPDDGANMQQRLARRGEIESAVSAALLDVGAVTGVGLGVHFTYVDLTLRDLDVGLARLVSKLRELGLPRDSFVHFFDSELSEEWLSIWPDAQLLVG